MKSAVIFRLIIFILIIFRSQRSTAADDDDIITPYMKVKDTPSRTAWDEEEGTTPGKFSSWDVPTPAMERRERVTFGIWFIFQYTLKLFETCS